MLACAIFWLVVASLAAVAARALVQFSPHELTEIGRRRGSPGRIGQVLRYRDQVALASETVQVMATAAAVATAVCWAWIGCPAALLEWRQLAVALPAGVILLLAANVWLPWAIARLWAEPFLYFTWPAWRAIGWVLRPLVWAADLVDVVLHRLAGRPRTVATEESFEDDIRTMVSEGHREGLLEEEAREMIEGVMELGDADVAQIMTPRTDMVSLSAALSWPEMLELVIKAGHTRVPVYGRSRDDIIGVLYAKDLLPELAKPPEARAEPWTKLLREPLFVPESKPIDALLREFQRGRHHLAVVLDEYGGVSGLVTMEDVLEEIVGEIVDEYDTALVEGIREVGPGVFEVHGRVHLDEINERLGLDLPEDADYDTIAGFVFSELGHVPVVNEQLVWRKVRITVLEATRRRIERLRLEALVESPEAAT